MRREAVARKRMQEKDKKLKAKSRKEAFSACRVPLKKWTSTAVGSLRLRMSPKESANPSSSVGRRPAALARTSPDRR